MYTLGLSAFFHNSAACLFQDGRLLWAQQEERFSRVKSDPSFPWRAVRHMLAAQDLTIRDVGQVCYYEDPRLKLERQMAMGLSARQMARVAERFRAVEETLRLDLDYQGPVHYARHHRSHFANALFQSGWREGNYLTVDSVGEKETLTWGRFDSRGLEQFGSREFPHSLGVFYSALTALLGFSVNDEEYKVMGLAAHGTPRFAPQLEKLFLAHGSVLMLDTRYFQLEGEGSMYTPELSALLGVPTRLPGEPLTDVHRDLAASAQAVLERELTQLVQEAFPQGAGRLLLSGGVAHNSLANQRLSELPGMQELFVPAAPNDVGSAIGACVMYALEERQELWLLPEREAPYWGASARQAELGVAASWIRPVDLPRLARELMAGAVVAVCQGRMEFGDRALLAYAGNPEVKEVLNGKIKRREDYRPFAPVVRSCEASEYFLMAEENLVMSKTYPVRPAYRERLSAVLNADGSARVQTLRRSDNPWLDSLLVALGEQQALPVLVNTSLNVNGEPIVLDDYQALDLFLRTDVDALVLETGVLYKTAVPAKWLEAYRAAVRGVALPRHRSTYEFL